MLNNPTENFSVVFPTDIWRIVADTERKIFAVELREPLIKRLEVKVTDLEKKTTRDVALDLNWWSSISGVGNGNIVIQKFKDSKFPEPNGIIVYNYIDQEIKKETIDGCFAFFIGNEIVYTKPLFENINYYLLPLDEAEPIKELTEEEIRALTPPEIKISIPQQYLEGNIHFNTVQRFVGRCTGKLPVKAIEYLETDSYIIVSYYLRSNKNLNLYLLLTNHEGALIMDSILLAGVEGINKDTFFLKENLLIFIKNKQELHSYVL